MDENDQNRRILLSIAGARIPGGCHDCNGYSVVHTAETVDDLADVRFRLAVYHDESCPFYRLEALGA